jgi:ABC-type sugar transport system permease subunit
MSAITQAKQKQRLATKRRSRLDASRYWGLWLISPWLIGLVLLKLVPIIASFGYSLTDYRLLEPDKIQFVGLKNYADLLTDFNIRPVLWRTASVALWLIPLQTGFSILFASILSSPKLLMKNTIRALFFLPSIIPATAATFMWQGFVNPGSGWLNRLILSPLGLEQFNIFAGRGAGQNLFLLGSVWMIGPGMLIIMGAMQGVPTELLEAAWVDGVNRWRRFVSITLPLVTPAIFFTLVLNFTAVFSGTLLLDRGFGFRTDFSSFDNYIYFILFRAFRVGNASALAWFFFIIVLIFVLILFKSAQYWVYFPDQEQD